MSTPLEENACDALTRRTGRLQRHQETIRRIYHRVSEQPGTAHLRRRAELAFYRVGKLILGSKAIPDKKKLRPGKSRPTPPVFSADDDTAARELIDAAYDVVEIYDVNGSPYNQVWKQAWLKRANEIVPQFF